MEAETESSQPTQTRGIGSWVRGPSFPRRLLPRRPYTEVHRLLVAFEHKVLQSMLLPGLRTGGREIAPFGRGRS